MNKMFPQYTTELFSDIYESVEDFITDYKGIGIPNLITDANAETLFYLLYARYGNSPIANLDVNQFKYKLFSIIWQYGPTWEERLALQKTIRDLDLEAFTQGSRAIYNAAVNPGQTPTTSTTEELEYINQQNTTNYKRSIAEAIQTKWDLLNTDVSNDFLNKFRVCFKQFVAPERPLLYVSDAEDDE